jgi:hypothetical protein
MSSARIDHCHTDQRWLARTPGRSKRKGRAPQQQGQKPSPASASQRRPPPGSQPTQTHWSPPSLCPPRRRLPPRPPLYYNPVGTTLTITASNPSLHCSNPTHRRLLPPGSRVHSSTRRRPKRASKLLPLKRRRHIGGIVVVCPSRQRGAGRSDRTWDRFLPFSR